MDPGNHMEQVWKTLKELQEKATKLKAECDEELKLKLKLHRSDVNIKKRQEHQEIDRYIISQRNLLDEGLTAEQNNISMAMKASLRDLMTKALKDQRAAFDEKTKQERLSLNQALTKLITSNDANIKMEREKVDIMIKQACEQLDKGLENERSHMKSLIESLVEKEEVRGTVEEVRATVNEEVGDGVFIPRCSLVILMDNECRENVVMRFKVHIVEERYPDLQKYFDSRENNIGQFTITKPHTSVEFVVMLESLRDFGYRGNAELYYLDPTPGSELSTGLKKIEGQEEVNELVRAHDEERTKICHLYLVGPEAEVVHDDMADVEYYDDDDSQGHMSP